MEKLKSEVKNFLLQTCHRKKTEQNTFFIFLGFFVEFWLLVEGTNFEIEKFDLKMGNLAVKMDV